MNSTSPLLTDLYQLTMAYGYWRTGNVDTEAVFHLYFRKNPFNGGYAIACGLDEVISWINEFKFLPDDIEYLASLKGNDKRMLFDYDFLEYLQNMNFSLDIDAIPEGTVVFPHEPLIRVKGPIIQCQLLETALLQKINFSTLIATKASRICYAAGLSPVLEFGLRRAQEDLVSSRAAFIGGCSATSNVLAGKVYGIPVKGTHAHSWVMSYDNELESFEKYAQVMPNNCVFLIDTYDTLKGAEHAATVGRKLSMLGAEMIGVRLDSGDLAKLSKEVRRILDENGMEGARIFASNDLDEYTIESIKYQKGMIDVWGVGTKLITAYDQPALGGVYKLAAIKRKNEQNWSYKIKLSEQIVKISNPGILDVKRYFDKNKKPMFDVIFDINHEPVKDQYCFDNNEIATKSKKISDYESTENLLKPIYRGGGLVYFRPSIDPIREWKSECFYHFPQEMKRLQNPEEYFVGLEHRLSCEKMEMLAKYKMEKNNVR